MKILRKQSIIISLILGILSGILMLLIDSKSSVKNPWWVLIPLIFGIVISIVLFIIDSKSNNKDKIINSILFLILYYAIHWVSIIFFWFLGLGQQGM